jgi:hypothetical protein
MSAFGGKTDMTFAVRSADHSKRTSPGKTTILRRYGNPGKMAFFFIAI